MCWLGHGAGYGGGQAGGHGRSVLVMAGGRLVIAWLLVVKAEWWSW